MALDLGSDNLKVVEVVQRGSNFELRDFLVKRLPKSLIKSNQFDFNQVVEILRPIFKNRFSAANLSLIISGSRIITKLLDLPQVEDEELDKLVSWEVQNIIAKPLEELVIDYELLSADENRMKVLVVITYKELLLKEINLLESLGLQVTKVKAAPLLWRKILSTELKDKNLAIIDLGEQETELTVLREEEFDFRRIFYLGGSHFTAEIEEGQDLSYRKAKALKESSEFKLDLVSDSLNKLVKKISLSIHYWEQQEKEIEQVLLTGGSAKLKGLKKMIAKKLNVEVNLLAGYEQFQFAKGEFSFHSLKEELPFLIPSLSALLDENKIS